LSRVLKKNKPERERERGGGGERERERERIKKKCISYILLNIKRLCTKRFLSIDELKTAILPRRIP